MDETSTAARSDISAPVARLILASASPRRRELLHAAGYDFDVHPANVDEEDYPADILPSDLALRLAVLKATELSDKFPDAFLLGADTVVAFGDRSIGKPEDAKGAFEMLQLLSGTTHVVITGVCVIRKQPPAKTFARVLSSVRMKELTNRQIQAYVDTDDWQGKAGGYGIQDERDEPFVMRMGGSHTNIVGLPLKKTIELLNSVGIKPTRPCALQTID